MRKTYRPRPHSDSRSSPEMGKSKHGLHRPVMLAEVIEQLKIKPNGIYVDATFGRGGHAKEILKHLAANGRLLALDKDPEAIKSAAKIGDNRFQIRQGSFTLLKKWLDEQGLIGKVDGVLLDLGVSSPQLDQAVRGFSFLRDGALDMRMDPTQGEDAASWINRASEEDIARVLKTFGEERFSKRIAKAIVSERQVAAITITGRLADIITAANPKWEQHKHPATRSFQAIRIYINNELAELKDCLEQSLEVLALGGRLVTISFHSLEDRIVKQFIREYAQGAVLPREIPITKHDMKIRLKKIGGAIKASQEETKNNPRARSAVLRVAEKIA